MERKKGEGRGAEGGPSCKKKEESTQGSGLLFDMKAEEGPLRAE